VEAQSYPRWELIVVDDGSIDATPGFLAGLEDPRIRSLRTDGLGACAARNAGLDAAHGELVAYLDDDNAFAVDWLKAIVWTFDVRPEADVAYGARIVDDEGRLFLGASSGRPWMHFQPWDPGLIREGNVADMNAMAHRAGAVRFDPELAFFGDWDLLLQLTHDTSPVEIPAVAVYYRTDAGARLSALSAADKEREHAHIRRKLAAR
jgi:glycosyltransferase involved in cell wall biosynthesis